MVEDNTPQLTRQQALGEVWRRYGDFRWWIEHKSIDIPFEETEEKISRIVEIIRTLFPHVYDNDKIGWRENDERSKRARLNEALEVLGLEKL